MNNKFYPPDESKSPVSPESENITNTASTTEHNVEIDKLGNERDQSATPVEYETAEQATMPQGPIPYDPQQFYQTANRPTERQGERQGFWAKILSFGQTNGGAGNFWQQYRNYIIFAGLLLVLGWWLLGAGNPVVVSGEQHNKTMSDGGGENLGSAITQSEKLNNDVPDIVVMNSDAVDYTPNLLGAGVTVPLQQTTLKSAINGRVEKKWVKEGMLITKDTKILSFQRDANMERLRAAEKKLRLMQIQINSERKLASSGLSSPLNMAQMEANLADMQAMVAEQKRVVRELDIKAPFDGIVTDYSVEVGDYLGPAQAIANFVAVDKLYVDIWATTDQVDELAIGDKAVVILSDKSERAALVDNISAVSDRDTRTVRVRLRMQNADLKIKGQEPVTVKINLPVLKAHKIPPTAIALNDQGVVGVKVLGPGDTVQFLPVKIVAQDSNVIWAKGLPEKITLLTEGQAFVGIGAKITPVYKNPPLTDSSSMAPVDNRKN